MFHLHVSKVKSLLETMLKKTLCYTHFTVYVLFTLFQHSFTEPSGMQDMVSSYKGWLQVWTGKEGLIYVYKHACLNQVNPVFCIKTSSPSRVTRANESPLNMTWCICTEVLHHRCENTGSVVISGYYTMTF